MINRDNEAGVRPGFHPAFDLQEFSESERKVLVTLAKEFYLTSHGSLAVLGKNAKYHYFLLKVPEEYSEEFNLRREVVCIFSSYSKFEPRTLDAYESAVEQYQSLRLESVCRILIAVDSHVEASLEGLIKSNPEQPIIVPFTNEELQSAVSSNFIRARFRKYFFTRNLYNFFSPLQKDLYFFGRTHTIQHLIARHESSENSGLFGLRRSGKTSVIYGVERAMSARGKRAITVDCQSPSVHQLRWNELLHTIVEATHSAKQSKVNLIERSAYTPQDAASIFEAEMLRVHASKKAEPVLLIFDEIERISPKTASSDHWRSQDDFVFFWQSVRAFFQRNRNVFTFMLVGTNPACIEASTINGQDNPIFGSIPRDYLPSFDAEQVAEMVGRLGKYMGLSFDPMLYGKLTDDFGGHPFLIRQVCSEIHDLASRDRPVQVDKPLYEQAVINFKKKSAPYLSMILDVLAEHYKDEYEMLRYLAAGDADAFNSLAKMSDAYTDHLRGYGLVTVSEHGASFRVECIKDFMLDRHKYSALSLSPAQREAEVSERRIRLEQGLRKIIRNQMKAMFGAKSARDKMLAAVPEKRREQLAAFELDQLFAPSDSPLYLLELIQLLSREWESFKHIFPFDKSKLILMLDEINSMRRDAHSNEISNDNFNELRIYFSKFDPVISEWA
ncbi:ATP-binding protein [Burkholderia cenocepacia]|uniref:ATP-binding protein n=1 Tax=Burkholderia cenocepacia TaxID=95486 RepID=UPI001B9FD3D1|nr:ATP-binding protein [Burkholderia cenocepacia]MBR8209951.1 ATP-binding protein [Burkholderia cenocepacia]